MVVVIGKERLHSFQYSGFIEPSDQSIVLFREHSFFAIGVRPFVSDELLELSCACLSVTDGALSCRDLLIPPHVRRNPHVPYSFKGSVNSGVDCELLIQEQEIRGLHYRSRPITWFGDERELVCRTTFPQRPIYRRVAISSVYLKGYIVEAIGVWIHTFHGEGCTMESASVSLPRIPRMRGVRAQLGVSALMICAAVIFKRERTLSRIKLHRRGSPRCVSIGPLIVERQFIMSDSSFGITAGGV